MAESSILTKTEIVIKDYNDNNPVVFSSLSLNESLISVNNFSFTLRPVDTNGSFSSIIDFKKKVLGKSVQIDFKDHEGNSNHKFNGVITEVNSSLVDEHYYEFFINGSGDFCKVNEIAECHSFYKKKLDAIIDKSFEKSSIKGKVKKNTQTSKELHYIVQYNQSLFSFMSTLAVRFGEWMYYDGENLQFGKKPEGESIELRSPGDVANLNIRAQAIKKPEGTVATDIFKSESVQSTSEENAPDNDFIKAAEQSGKDLFENPGGNIFLASGFSQAESDDKYKLEQQAILASSVFITGTTRNNKVCIGKKIKIKDATDDAGRTFIVTQTQHSASNFSNYRNSFTAIPVEVDVPPYTNPLMIPKATPQPAIVTDNEDDGGLARVKVKFPWMADDEKTPWISVLVPHAGKDKGFRFLPEKDDEVLVGFLNGNAETPFVTGSVYTNKNKPGIAESGNNIKRIGSRTGRRFEINDDSGEIKIYDGVNSMTVSKSDSESKIELKSESGGQSSKLTLKNDGTIEAQSMGNSGSSILTLNGKDVILECSGNFEITAGENISLTAGRSGTVVFGSNLDITTGQNFQITSGQGWSCTAGTNFDVTAGANANLTGGVGVALTGGATVDVQAGAMAKVQGAIVMIN